MKGLGFDLIDSSKQSKQDFDLAIFDGYGFNMDDFVHWGKVSKVAIFEDYPHRRVKCDLLIDANISLGQELTGELFEGATNTVSGPEFIILGDYGEVADDSRELDSGLKPSLLLTFGGSDPMDFTSKIAERISGYKHLFSRIGIVIGPYFSDKEGKVLNLRDLLGDVEVFVGLKGLIGTFSKFDAAVGAGGISAYERASVGLPSINLVTTENQSRVARGLEQAGLSLSLDVRKALTHNELDNQIQELLKKPFRSFVKVNGPSIIDGNGARRSATEIRSLFSLDSYRAGQ